MTPQITKRTKSYQESIVDLLATKNIDMKHRRVVNASQSVDVRDYIIQQELTDLYTKLKKVDDENRVLINKNKELIEEIQKILKDHFGTQVFA